MEERGQFRELPIEPPGILWQDDFIDFEHEQRLISIFNELEWPDRPGRLALHYGYTFDYKTFSIDPEIPYKDFPNWLQPLIPTSEDRPPDQVCVSDQPMLRIEVNPLADSDNPLAAVLSPRCRDSTSYGCSCTV